MLVLTRREREIITIGDDLKVTIISVRRKEAEIGFFSKNNVRYVVRKKGDEILLGEDIKIVIFSIEVGKVKIGVSAPKEIPVHRKEVYDRINKKLNLEEN